MLHLITQLVTLQAHRFTCLCTQEMKEDSSKGHLGRFCSITSFLFHCYPCITYTMTIISEGSYELHCSVIALLLNCVCFELIFISQKNYGL